MRLWFSQSDGSGTSDLEVNSDLASRDANRAEHLAAAVPQRDASGERSEPAVGQLEARRRCTGLAVLPDHLAIDAEENRGSRFPQRDVDRPQHRAIHSAEGL